MTQLNVLRIRISVGIVAESETSAYQMLIQVFFFLATLCSEFVDDFATSSCNTCYVMMKKK